MDLDKDILFPPVADASTIVLECNAQDYSASVIARAVEDCDAHVINLNVLATAAAYGGVQVALRIDHRDPSPVVRSLRRFGYEAVDIEAPEGYDTDEETARSRANELIRYLEI